MEMKNMAYWKAKNAASVKKSPLEKELIGNQHKLPEHLKAKIEADAVEMGGSTVADIEKKIDDAIAELNAPTTAEGTPWVVSE